jgi:hypothetical protein
METTTQLNKESQMTQSKTQSKKKTMSEETKKKIRETIAARRKQKALDREQSSQTVSDQAESHSQSLDVVTESLSSESEPVNQSVEVDVSVKAPASTNAAAKQKEIDYTALVARCNNSSQRTIYHVLVNNGVSPQEAYAKAIK